MKRFAWIFFLTVLVDQLTKFISPYFGHQLQINQGISFAWFAGGAQVVLIIASFVVIVGLALQYGYFWAKHPLVAGLFFGGAVSNLVDRLIFAGVRDWIVIPYLGVRNNFADLAIISSLLIILWLWQRGVEV